MGVNAAREGGQERGEHFICKGERFDAVYYRKAALERVDRFVDDARLASRDVWLSYYPTMAVKGESVF